MTAEVIVMNKTAVALASDSAATVTAKVFNSAEKLFMLVPGKPVGLMINNFSEFMQLPWETIVKQYRNLNGTKDFKTLHGYAKDFLDFLGDQKNGLYNKLQYEITFSQVVQHYYHRIAVQINNEVRHIIEDRSKRVSDIEIITICHKWIDLFYDKWNNYEDLYPQEELSKFKKDLKKYNEILNELRDTFFGSIPLTSDYLEKLNNFAHTLFYKKRITDFYTGLVFAGFGANEQYPSCVEYIVENYICGKLKYTKLREYNVNAERIGCVIPFAQEDIVKNFLDGIHPDFMEKLDEELSKDVAPEIIKEIQKTLKGIRKEKREKITNDLNEIQKKYKEDIFKSVTSDFRSRHTDSVMQTVAILPKDELANMAESLVNITSFMRRVSMEIESVGGPIDVVVISKKDGFIWIKRKHYFDIKHNPIYNNFPSRG